LQKLKIGKPVIIKEPDIKASNVNVTFNGAKVQGRNSEESNAVVQPG
jgi:hypothetical protein